MMQHQIFVDVPEDYEPVSVIFNSQHDDLPVRAIFVSELYTLTDEQKHKFCEQLLLLVDNFIKQIK